MENLELFCQADPLHFAPPEQWNPAWSWDYTHLADQLGQEWQTKPVGTWLHAQPVGGELPEQGWKIHVSATVDNAEDVIARTIEYLADARAPFKYLLSRALVAAVAMRGIARGSAGKVLTVYPRDDDAFISAADALGRQLRGFEGPAVLSDRRWVADAPVYFRYGAFVASQTYTEDGRRVFARRDGHGDHVEDVRAVPFRPPSDVTIHSTIAERLDAARPASTPAPVRVEAALRHSSSGGLYRGRLEDGTSVIVKEARPFTGGTPKVPDSPARLANEASALRICEANPYTPRLFHEFTVSDHSFIAIEEVPGNNLQHWVAANHPYLNPNPPAHQVSDYLAKTSTILSRLEHALQELHRNGLGHNDLHPGNVMVSSSLEVRLVDLESASAVDEVPPRAMDCPGFAPEKGTARSRDLFALKVIQAWMLVPTLGAVVEFSPQTAHQYADLAAEWFGDSWGRTARGAATVIAEQVRRNAARHSTTLGPASSLDARRLIRHIEQSCSPKGNVMVAGDPDGFASTAAALSVANGLAGVVIALADAGRQAPSQWLEWAGGIIDTSQQTVGAPGLWDGWAGVALMWRRVGDHDQARRCMDLAETLAVGCTDPSLHSGLAGIGLTLLRLGADLGDDGLLTRAAHIANELQADVAMWSSRLSDGLMRGPSGVSLFLSAAAQQLQAPGWLASAEEYLRIDLDKCRPGQTGAFSLCQGNLVKAYLGEGSLGVAMARRALRTQRGQAWDQTDRQLTRASFIDVTVEPGLLRGQAGLAYGLARLAVECDDAAWAARMMHHATRLHDHIRLHAVSIGDAIAITGRGGCRLSVDLATGTAGVLAIKSALHREPVRTSLDEVFGWLPNHEPPARDAHAERAQPMTTTFGGR